MLNTSHILPKKYASKAKGTYAKITKAFLGSNLAFAIIATSGMQTSYIAPNQSDLLIPEAKLETSFDIQTSNTSNQVAQNQANQPGSQIPVEFSYMSQGFHSYHPGIDLASEIGDPIKPIMTGTVEQAGRTYDGYGNMILIDHGNGLESLYAHLSKIEVKIGDIVNMNTIIGLVGITGHTTGPHLHLEIHQDGVPVNPLSYLPSLTKVPRLLTLNQR